MGERIKTDDQGDFEINQNEDWSITFSILVGLAFLIGVGIVAFMTVAVIADQFFKAYF